MWVEMYNTGNAAKAQAEILAVLNGPNGWGGQAKAASDAAGAQEKLKDRINALKESIGGLVRGVLDKAAIAVMAFVDAFNNGDITSDGWVGQIERVGVAARHIFEEFRDKWLPVIADFVQRAGELFQTLFGTFVADYLPKIIEFVQAAIEIFGQMFEFLRPSIEALARTFVQDLLPALERLWVAIQPLLPVLGVILTGIIS